MCIFALDYEEKPEGFRLFLIHVGGIRDGSTMLNIPPPALHIFPRFGSNIFIAAAVFLFAPSRLVQL